jgi:2-phosphosulfolactate phosphatase
MQPVLNVFALPKVVAPEEMADGVVVMIDVLRASTTICMALEAGAERVIPCLEVDDARRTAADLPGGDVVLGGERQCQPIEGFDLGNSPRDYLPERVAGRTVVLTTTNGTRALQHAHLARRVLIGAFVNATAVFEQLIEQQQIHILCAGTNDMYSEDDALLAGMLVERLQRVGGLNYRQNAQAMTAREYWLSNFALPQAVGGEPLDPELLARKLAASTGGRPLMEQGFQQDVRDAAEVDLFSSVPVYCPLDEQIRL